MLGTKKEIARLQSDFYRDKFRSTLTALFISIFLSIVLLCGIIYLVLFKEPPQYYATTMEGKIIVMNPNTG